MPTIIHPSQGYALGDIFAQAYGASSQRVAQREQQQWERARAERHDAMAASQASQAAERNKAIARGVRLGRETGDWSDLEAVHPDLAIKFQESAAKIQGDQATRAKAAGEADLEQAKRRAAFEFAAARSVRQDPGGADALQPDAERVGAQVPGYRVQVAGDPRPIEVPPDVAAARTRAEGLGVKVEAPQAMDLRKELASSPVFKAAQEVKTARDKVLGAPANAVGDMSLIYGVMKLQDPASTVREGEYASAEDTKGVAGWVSGLYNKIVSGEKLTDEQRRQFKSEAARLYQVQREKLEPQLADFRKLAADQGIDPGHVVLFSWGDEQARQSPARPEEPQPQTQPQPAPDKKINNVRSAYQSLVAQGASPEEALRKLVQSKAISPEQAEKLLPLLTGAR